jgi:hypothetical protein
MTMLDIQTAADERFESATLPELREYAKELGIEESLKPTMNGEKIRGLLLAALGIEQKMAAALRPAPMRVVRGNESIFPSYNLTPLGVWGGRRHRVKLPRPEGQKIANAEGFGWNGKATYYVPYDEVANIPEPILNIIQQNKRRRAFQKRIPMPDGTTEITTAFEFDDIPLSYLGVDPETKDLAGSLMEWYQSKGPEWFEARSISELTSIGKKCDLPMRTDRGKDSRPMEHEEALATLKLFFFNFPDAVSQAAA